VVSKQLLEMLVCPLERLPLEPAEADLLARLNRQIEEGRIINRAGIAVGEEVSEALVRNDGKMLYIVRDAIPIMLADEAINLDQLSTDQPS